MAIDYTAITEEYIRRFGTDTKDWGQKVLADRYGDRAHFIYELLQNAEDALARRGNWKGSRSVTFELSRNQLRVSHYGEPFDKPDVKSICGICLSTKPESSESIGKFGIGFKSVYAFTDLPEIHSGNESFAIDSFVRPYAIESIHSDLEKTTFVFPFRENDEEAFQEIANRLKKLGARTLLFLREIEEINWSIEGDCSGFYLRSKPEKLGVNQLKVSLIGQQEGEEETEETWQVFSKEVFNEEESSDGLIEIAFLEEVSEGETSIISVPDSKLAVYFPTILQTNLGFLVQGPYSVTLSRDNITRNSKWNDYLVKETAHLLIEALHLLKGQEKLDLKLLECLPLDRNKFTEDCLFTPIFDIVCDALQNEELLLSSDGGYTSANNAKIGRTKEIKELFDTNQLTALYRHDETLHWLIGDITRDSKPELFKYLTGELGISNITPEMAISRLDKQFLESQTDEWITKLYEYLNGISSLKSRYDKLPLIRLDDDSHVSAVIDNQIQAFLPGEILTDFPKVKCTVCQTEEARKFLKKLGIEEPDPVDDVIRNILPRYLKHEIDVDDNRYDQDIHRILIAFETDSLMQRNKLINALREPFFVRAVSSDTGEVRFAKPAEVYLPSERMKKLFSKVDDILIVDDSLKCLKGDSIRKLLEACGASRELKRIEVNNQFTTQELVEIRRNAGLERATWGYGGPIHDHTLMGLRELFELMPELDIDGRREKALLLWEALDLLVSRRGAGVFKIDYSWGYSHLSRTVQMDADFVKELNKVAWIPDEEGELQRPELVLFDSLDWKSNPTLLSIIHFKPPIIEELAKEAGFEPGMLDLLKKMGVTSEDELRLRLNINNEEESDPPETEEEMPDPTTPEGTGTNGSNLGKAGGGYTRSGTGTGGNGESKGNGGNSGGAGGNNRTAGSKGGRPFISYVGAHPNEDGGDGNGDGDGSGHSKRLELEEKAITLILSEEIDLQYTPTNNPGFDLCEKDLDGNIIRRVEVKAMSGAFTGRPVGLSRTQFEYAREYGEAYWLYVVENVEDEENARIFRINDPAGKACTFTFDHGWMSVAEEIEE